MTERIHRIAQTYAARADADEIHVPDTGIVEFTIVRRQFARWIPEGARVAQIGAAAADYAEALARRGCSIYLVDISPSVLDIASARLSNAGFQTNIAGTAQLSATSLQPLESGSFDAVLLHGTLYHLFPATARQQAVREAARILKPRGVVMASGLNRITYLRDLLRDAPQLVTERKAFHHKFLGDGNLDPAHAVSNSYAHLTTAEEFRGLFAADFEMASLLGIESFSGPWQAQIAGLTPAELQDWLELIEATASTTEGLGCADHFLYIGRRPDISKI